MNFGMTLLLLYWSGFIGTRGYFRTYTSTGTISILRSCMIPGCPSTSVTPKGLWVPCFIITFPAGDKPSPKAKLTPTFLDHLTKFPIDSCIREYRDWTTNCEGRSSPDEHFMWLSSKFTPFQTDPGTPYVPPDFTLGLPAVEDWPKRTGEVPWVLDPAEHHRPAIQSHHKSASPSSGDERWKRRKKKKHCQPKKQELKVTTWGQGGRHPRMDSHWI